MYSDYSQIDTFVPTKTGTSAMSAEERNEYTSEITKILDEIEPGYTDTELLEEQEEDEFLNREGEFGETQTEDFDFSFAPSTATVVPSEEEDSTLPQQQNETTPPPSPPPSADTATPVAVDDDPVPEGWTRKRTTTTYGTFTPYQSSTTIEDGE